MQGLDEVAQRGDQERARAHRRLADLEVEDLLGRPRHEAIAVAFVAERLQRALGERDRQRRARVERARALAQPARRDEVKAARGDDAGDELLRAALSSFCSIRRVVGVRAARPPDEAGGLDCLARPSEHARPCVVLAGSRPSSSAASSSSAVVLDRLVRLVARPPASSSGFRGVRVVTRSDPVAEAASFLNVLSSSFSSLAAQLAEARERQGRLAADVQHDDRDRQPPARRSS